jgi:hypothetical protein
MDDDIRRCGMAFITTAVIRAKREGVSFETLIALYRAFSRVSSIGPEFLYFPDVAEAIAQGLNEQTKGEGTHCGSK